MIDERGVGGSSIAKSATEFAEADAFERIRFQVRFVGQALQGLLVVNGVAVLTSIVLLVVHAGGGHGASCLWGASCLFAFGVVLALGTYAGAFLSQGAYYHKSLADAGRTFGSTDVRQQDVALKAGQTFETLALTMAIGSLFVFALGAAFDLWALRPV